MRIEDLLREGHNNTPIETLSYEDTKFYQVFGDAKLYHSSYDNHEGYVHFAYRENPRDTFAPFHHEVNTLAKQRFGLPIRSLLFTTTDANTAQDYSPGGTVYSVCPVSDRYRLFYSRNTEDMTTDLNVSSAKCARRIMRTTEDTLDDIAGQRSDPDADVDVRRMGFHIRKEVIDYVFKPASPSANIGIARFFENLTHQLHVVMRRHGCSDVECDRMKDALIVLRTSYQNLAYDYIQSIIEITDADQLLQAQGREIMVYDPSGFLLVK